jgi:hypothetical protein
MIGECMQLFDVHVIPYEDILLYGATDRDATSD